LIEQPSLNSSEESSAILMGRRARANRQNAGLGVEEARFIWTRANYKNIVRLASASVLDLDFFDKFMCREVSKESDSL